MFQECVRIQNSKMTIKFTNDMKIHKSILRFRVIVYFYNESIQNSALRLLQ